MGTGRSKLVQVGEVIRIGPNRFQAHPDEGDDCRAFANEAAGPRWAIAQKKIEKRRGEDGEKSVTREIITHPNVDRAVQHQGGVEKERNKQEKPSPFVSADNANGGPEDGSHRKGQERNSSFQGEGDREI